MASIAPTRRLSVGSGLRGNHFRGPVRASYRALEAPGLRLELAASRANANACSREASAINRLRLGIRVPKVTRERTTMPKTTEVLIGKFDILATYTYAKALLEGASEPDAKERGIVAAIMGAKVKSGHAVDHKAQKSSAEKKKKTTITAEVFDRQVSDKMGAFFDAAFLPGIKKLVKDGMTYDAVKRRVRIPSIWGAKITGGDFVKRAKP